MRWTVTPPRNRGLFPCPKPTPTPRPLAARTPRLPAPPVTGRRLGCCPLPVWLSAVSGLRGRPCMRLVACGGWPRVGSLLRLSGLRWPAAVVAAAACWAVAGLGVAWRAGCRRPSVAVLPVAVGRGLVRGRWRRVLVVPVLVGFLRLRRAGGAVRGRLRLRRCGAGVRRRPAWNSVTAGVVTAGRVAVTRLPVRLAAVGGGAVPRTEGRTADYPRPVRAPPPAVTPVTVARAVPVSGVLTALPGLVVTG